MCPGKTLSSALLFCLTCPRAMDAVREELSTINGEVFVRLLTSVNTFVGLVRLKQIVNMSILRFNSATGPDCHTFKRFLFHCSFPQQLEAASLKKITLKVLLETARLASVLPIAPPRKITGPIQVQHLQIVWGVFQTTSSLGWKTCAANWKSGSGDNSISL